MLSFLKSRPAQVATVLLVAQAIAYYGLSRKEIIPEIIPWSEFPAQASDWSMVDETPMDPAVFEQLRPDAYVNRNYLSAAGEPVGLFIGYFKTQRNGYAPHSPQDCLPGAGWESVSASVVPLPLDGGTPTITVNEFVVAKDNQKLLVIYWYQQRDRAFLSQVRAQMFAVPDMLLHGRTDIALVRVIAPALGGDLDKAKAAAVRFSRQIYPSVRKHIG